MESLNITTVDSPLISDELTRYIIRILMFIVTPTIAIFGITGNVMSIIVLIKHGLHKCSNILLVALAFSDITYLISFNSVPKIFYEAVNDHEFLGFNVQEASVVFFFFSVFNFLDYSVGLMSLVLPMLITIERLVVIFLPLSFKRVITPKRTWIAVISLEAYFFSICLYTTFWFELDYTTDTRRNLSVGLIRRSTFFYEHLPSVEIIQNILVYSSIIIPPIFTAVGCIIISIKIQITSTKRRKLTSKSKNSNRTTRMLLAVCAVYIFTITFLSLPIYIPEYASYSLTDEAPSNVGKLFYQLVNIVGCINSSTDFIVYILLNKNFRATYQVMMGCREKVKR
ncbi:FMRFamide peptide receptor frpr-18-like [Physella acuta]|uniref:FMRFamide peptide receptor frpr-18-like n=1 Tax=Physella acuta TaxID=109671 RepID=UPI0027DC31E1|nr:FMRFamide peptide receptor frpr-18-like [Physella acuta]